MGFGVMDRFDQLFDDMVGCGQVGIAHAEIDDIRPSSARTRLHLVHLGENIGRQTFDSVKTFLHATIRYPVDEQRRTLAKKQG